MEAPFFNAYFTMGLTLVVQIALVWTWSGHAWEDHVQPRIIIQYNGLTEGLRFRGNETSKDYFRLLEQDADHVLVGAKNMVYNISLRTMTETSKLEWHADEDTVTLCQVKGKSEEQCQNYIRVLAKKSSDKLFVCGTYAFKPQCRDYVIKADGRFSAEKTISGQGLCPYDPVHNSTALLADGELYVATTADFSGTDPLIYREGVRTEQYDLKHLNEPDFVTSFAYEGYVFFFFREMAVEYTNCGKAVYSRVGRVCKKDRGGPHNFKKRWTSFTKARLNCSVPGQFPFYFNQIQSASELVKGNYGEEEVELVYATFTTDPNSIWGSAVCAFNMRAILDTFSGPFKEQEKPYSNWLPVKSANVPEPRPGQCVENSTTLTDVTLNFVKNHPLMDEAVPNFFPQPVFIRSSFDPTTKYRFTKIAVDPQVRTTDGRAYDVLFIGTDDGRVLKVVNSMSFDTKKEVRPVVIEDLQVFPRGKPVTNLHLVGDKVGRGSSARWTSPPSLVVMSDDEIISLPIQRCSKANTCSKCVYLQDPYCGWDSKAGSCSPITNADGGFIQKVSRGESPSCPDYGSGHEYASHVSTEASSAATGNSRSVASSGEDGVVGNELEDPYDYRGKEQSGSVFPVIQDSPRIYSAETFAIAVTTACVVALIVGFVSGYMFSRRCRADDLDGSYTDIRFPSDPPLGSHVPPGMACDAASYLPHTNNKSINLVINVPPKNNSNKNPNSAADNKPIQKVKKIYL